ncbi:hypothetical protein F53441_6171 [Fusarium austroafricanum]|uniref:Carboxylesterase family protein n=1 Tax=Fusarium austroafricanum TaxID=2364996 RepID=A0A8H4KJ72_9HYPO|nr:hypothetical protein F53441_6171 [Fusarium austroafricanum]
MELIIPRPSMTMDHQPQVHHATSQALAFLGPAAGQDVNFVQPNSASRPSTSIPSSSQSSRRGLQELSADQVHNKSLARKSPRHDQKHQSYLKSSPIKLSATTTSPRGLRRPPVSSDTFEPLDVVPEESIESSDSDTTASEQSPLSTRQVLTQANTVGSHPLLDEWPLVENDITKLRTGQFEWLLSVQASARNSQDRGSLDNSENNRHDIETKVYGCYLMNRRPLLGTQDNPEADLFTFVATPLIAEEYLELGFDPSQISPNTVNMALPPPPAYELHQTVPLKVPEVVEVVEPVSPSTTLISERSSSYAGSSRNGSFSVPRIEDSFEELDKLEDELEAIKAFTQPQRITFVESTASNTKHLEPPSASKRSTLSKRASVIGMSSTVRIKQTEKAQPPLRRSTSLVFRDKKQDDSDNTPKSKPEATRGKLPSFQPVPSKAPVKSTKAPTIPNFELPGEAISRRLREQREARRAQQAEAQKAYVPPPRPKSSKPLTKPNFELPGEAISRRKREEREARLKAQEEEEQKKREFKARPIRNSLTPGSLPRETITSLARQGKLPQDEAANLSTSTKAKRMSTTNLRPVATSETQAPQSRGRLHTATSREDLSRGTSTSTGSSNGKRATLTAEEAHQLKLRGKEIFQRDNTSFTRDREREKREREEATRLAREQAAERSRIASREWAEKKRRKEQAMLESLRGQ